MSIDQTLSKLRLALRGMNYSPCSSEKELEDQVVTRLAKLGVEFQRQVIASADDRFDILIEGSIVIEIKVSGSASELLRQVARYARHQCVSDIIVVTTRASHKKLIAASPIHGKMIEVLLVGWI